MSVPHEVATSSQLVDPTASPAPPLDRRFLLAISLAQFGLAGSAIAPSIVGLPMRIAALAPTEKTGALSLVMAIGAVFGLVSQPLAGRFSDRTTSPFGRRRPWLIAGSLAIVVGLFVVALVPSIPAVVAGWSLTMVGFNTAQAALYATMFDQVPAAHRSKVTGALGAALTLSMLMGVTLLSQLADTRLELLVPPVVGFFLVGYFAVTMKDDPRPDKPRPLSLKELAGTYWTDVTTHRDFGWVWVSRALVMLAIMAPPSYIAFYVMDRLNLSSAAAPSRTGILMMLYFGGITVSTGISGYLSDRFAVRKPFVIASALAVGIGLILLATAPTYAIMALAVAVIGLGGGMFYAVDLALVSEVMPDAETVGKDFGVINLAIALPQVLAPALAAAALGVRGDNYLLFFGILGAMSLLGSVVVTRVRSVR
jgi:MFS family permease